MPVFIVELLSPSYNSTFLLEIRRNGDGLAANTGEVGACGPYGIID